MLGLYDDFLAENLHSIRRVRNAFAHARKPVSFASDQIIKECTSLKIADPVRKNMPKRPSLTARQLYIDYVIATLIHFNEGTLKIGAKNLQRMKREIRKSRQRQAKLAQLVLQVEEAREVLTNRRPHGAINPPNRTLMAFVIAIIIRERAHARPHHLGGGLFVVGRCRPVGQSLWLLILGTSTR